MFDPVGVEYILFIQLLLTLNPFGIFNMNPKGSNIYKNILSKRNVRPRWGRIHIVHSIAINIKSLRDFLHEPKGFQYL
jgi:hypothetical protein